jgi:hypothetical protein
VYPRWLVRQGLLLAGMLLATHAFAQQPTFPFLQEGGARSAFVGGSRRTCLEKQRAAPENASLSAPELGGFCLCYGLALADLITGTEYEVLALGKVPDGFSEKQRRAGNVCISRMSTSEQLSRDSQLKVAIENRCRKEFHPDGCYAGAVTSSGKEARNPRDAADYCAQHMGPNG